MAHVNGGETPAQEGRPLPGRRAGGNVRGVDGVAKRVQRDREGAASVLRFVLEGDDGASAAVEMRGNEIRGVLDDGDRVALPTGSGPPGADRVHRPAIVHNQTTGSSVTAWRPSALRRLATPLLTTAGTAIVSSMVTLVVGALVTGESDSAQSVGPGVGPADGGGTDADGLWVVFAVGAAGAVAWFSILARRRRRERRPIAGVLAGLTIGLAIGLAGLALLAGA